MMKNVYVGWGPVGMTKIAAGQSKRLKLNQSKVTEGLDSEFQLSIISDFEGTPVWQSSNVEVAEVDQEGNVRIVGYGTAIITVTVGDLKGVCVINSPAPKPEPEPEPELPTNILDTTKIYYGVINPDLETFTGYSCITEQDLVSAFESGLLKETSLQSYSKLEIPAVGLQAIVILIPEDKPHVAYKNELDEQKHFDETNVEGMVLESNGDVAICGFKVYGELITVPEYKGSYLIDIE